MEGDEPVPKLPRGRGLKLSRPDLFRIAIMIAMLVAVVVLTRPCADATSHFVMSFGSGSAGSAMPKPGTVAPVPAGSQYERLRPGMTDEEIKAAIERAKTHAQPEVMQPAGSAAP